MASEGNFSYSSTFGLLRPLVATNTWRDFLIDLFDDEHATFERILTLPNPGDQLMETHRIITNDSNRRENFNQLCEKYCLTPSTSSPVPKTKLIEHTPLPSQPAVVVEPKPFQELLQLLMNESSSSVQITAMPNGRKVKEIKDGIVASGMGGIGKSLLAAEVVRDLVKGSQFRVICWINLGIPPSNQQNRQQWQKDYLTNCFKELAQQEVLGKEPSIQVDNLTKALNILFGDKPSLLVLDDVWANLERFAHKENVKILVTTRKQDLKINGRKPQCKIELEALDYFSSLNLFHRVSGISFDTTKNEERDELIKKCGGLPLALQLIGTYAESIKNFYNNEKIWDVLLGQLAEALRNTKEEEFSTVFTCIQMTMENGLNIEERERFKDFAIFPEDTWIHQDVLSLFWNPELPDCAPGRQDSVSSVLESLVRFSLVVKRTERLYHYYRVHDIILMYLRDISVPQAQTEAHQRLLDKYTAKCKYPGALWSGPLDPGCYLLENLGYHFRMAGKTKEAGECYIPSCLGQDTEVQIQLLDWLLAQHMVPKSFKSTPMLVSLVFYLCSKARKEDVVLKRNVLHKDSSPVVWQYLSRYWLPNQEWVPKTETFIYRPMEYYITGKTIQNEGYTVSKFSSSWNPKELIDTFWRLASTNPVLVDKLLRNELSATDIGTLVYP